MTNKLPLELTVSGSLKMNFSSGFFFSKKGLQDKKYGAKNNYVILETDNLNDYYNVADQLKSLKGIPDKSYMLAYKDEKKDTVIALALEQSMINLIKVQSTGNTDEMLIIISFQSAKVSENVGNGNLSVTIDAQDKP